MALKTEIDTLKNALTGANLDRLVSLKNEALLEFVAASIDLCRPATVTVFTDAADDIRAIREGALRAGEEAALALDGHTVHFDGPKDQARDPGSTKYLLPEGETLGARIRSIEREKGLSEIRGYLDGAMKGKEMLVCFFCLGPTGSDHSISCVQVTDSYYVAHSESILYRPGYEQFKRLDDRGAGGDARGDARGSDRGGEFFRFLHSAGELDRRGVSVATDKRRVYIDLGRDTVYSVNTQYAGNTVGLKKLALRLAIRKGEREGWLAEHMFLMGVRGPHGRTSFFTGAFPSASGKTSTAMLPGQTILGDDLAYIRNRNGVARAANVEAGVFGILQDVNARDDPVIWDALNAPGELIFSNVLVKDGKPYWLGMGEDVRVPASGLNFQGEWHKGLTDGESGSEVPLAHKNARYTIRISRLANRHPLADDPEGVPVSGIVFGGRDSDTRVPVEEAFDWTHGIITKGAMLESETTAAIIGRQGVRRWDPMSNIDFLSMSVGRYLAGYLRFGAGLGTPPRVFAVNYFLKGPDGRYLNSIPDKKAWILWAELRVHGDVGAIRTPTGRIPRLADLRKLFREHLDKDYSEGEYVEQFTVRLPEHLAKLDRMEGIFKAEQDIPPVVWDELAAERARLEEARRTYGKDRISPLELAEG